MSDKWSKYFVFWRGGWGWESLFFLFFVFYFLTLTSSAQAGAVVFSKEDRILVIAPHPDDEVLGCGGMIQSALAAGAGAKIVYLTHGESNEISSLFYQKRPMLLKSDFVKIGRLRKEEAVKAMSTFGVPEKNLIFFGYPDFGTMPIWEKHWENTKPYRSFFTRVNKVIHEDDFSYGKYYKGYNIVHDFEKVILDFKPTHIFVTAPFDLNLDHQAAYLFLNTALLNLEDETSVKPAVHLYLVHAHDWPKPKKYDPSADLLFPDSRGFLNPVWTRHELSREEIKLKEKALLYYKSQLSYSRNFLLSFVRKNEIYADYSFEDLRPEMGLPGEVRYALTSGELLIEIPLIYALDEMGTLSTNVFSYKEGMPFAQMPKLNFKLFGKKLFVKDRFASFFDKGILFKISKGRLFIRIPLKVLKEPDYLFVSTRTVKNQLALNFGTWRVIRIVRLTGKTR